MVICPSTRFKSIVLWPGMNHLVPGPWKSPGAPTTALVLPPPSSALSTIQNPAYKSDFYYVGQS